MSIDRTQPCETKLRWVPLGADEKPEPYVDLLLWNPCDGASEGHWDGERFYLDEGSSYGIGSATHWAILSGPEPSDDVSFNWKLWQGKHAEQDT